MKIFVTGATGYIGGSVAVALRAAGHEVRGLARSDAAAAKLGAIGIEPVIGTLAELDRLAAAARETDAVVNMANADDPYPATAFIAALAGSGKTLIHTSGSSIVGDKAEGRAGNRVYHEDTPFEPLPEKAGRVAIDRAVLAAAQSGVRSVVICPGLIYGPGRGPSRDSIQIPQLMRIAQETGAARHIGPGENIWSHVHIDDLTDLYLRALDRAPAGSFFFAESGETALKDMAAAVGRLLGLGGTTRPMTIDEAVRAWGPAGAHFSLGSNSRVRADKARGMLGWAPSGPALLDDIEHGSYQVDAARLAAA